MLNAALAVAASHHSRWQHTTDTSSRRYLRASCRSLRDRFADQNLISQPVTLACMLLLVTYEVFSGSSRWTGHYDAIKGWVRSRGDCSDLDAFLKNWVCLIDTQSALNLGTSTMPELEVWMDANSGRGATVDALFGCSARLPKLMVFNKCLGKSKLDRPSADSKNSQSPHASTSPRETASSPAMSFSSKPRLCRRRSVPQQSRPMRSPTSDSRARVRHRLSRRRSAWTRTSYGSALLRQPRYSGTRRISTCTAS